MLFHSLEFIFIFLPITWIIFALLIRHQKQNGALVWLTLASLVFYAYWNWPYLLLILASILGNFSFGKALHPHAGRPRGSPWVLGLAVAANLALLGYYKYANFFVDTINATLGVSMIFEKVFLPLAISFFTFTQIAYLVDTWRGETAKYTLLQYSFFVLFFPHLIAGPIVLHKELVPYVPPFRPLELKAQDFIVGLTIFAIGLFKKMVLADGAAVYVSPVFNAAQHGLIYSTGDTWVGVLGYAFQLYFDFSGYSDMAVGLARMFNVALPLNFNAPYRATNIIDFWRSWHITLSRFLRDYLYFSLGGSRKGVFLRYWNLLVVMLLGGLWHGAGWTFVLWGGLHGTYLIVNHGFRAVKGRLGFLSLVPKPIRLAGSWSLTFLCVLIGWVFFRAESMDAALLILKGMAGLPGLQTTAFDPATGLLFRSPDKFIWMGILLAIVLIAPTTHDYLSRFQPALGIERPKKHWWQFHWRPTALHAIFLGCLIFLTARRYFILAPTEFLYFNF